MKFTAGWVGGKDFKGWVSATRANQGIAVAAGVSAAADGARDEIRDQIVSAGLGTRLSNAVGSNTYPKAGKGSLDAAGYVFPRGKKANAIFDAFNRGVTVTANGGKYLAIPTKDAGRGAHFTTATPEEFQFRTGIKLQFVRLKNGDAVLVGQSTAAKSGRGVRAATKGRLAQGRKAAMTVFFVLIRSAREPRRLGFAAIAQKWADRIPALIDSAASEQGDV